VWYPAAPIGRAAPYVTDKESALLVRVFDPDLAADLLSTVVTHGRRDAPVWSRRSITPTRTTPPSSRMDTSPGALLDAPSAEFPEVAFRHADAAPPRPDPSRGEESPVETW